SWWRGEGNGLDSVSGNNASVPGNITYPAAEVGQGFNFDGTANLMVADTPALNPTNALTIECWVFPRTRLTQVTWTQDFFTKDGECGGRQYILQVGDHQTVSGAGDFRAAVWLSGGPVIIDSATVLQTNRWYHVAMTYDGSNFNLYVNGALDAQSAASGTIVVTPEPVRIGGGADGGCAPYYFNGILDEATIYNRALSSNEISAVYMIGAAGKCFTPMPPVIIVQPTNQTALVGSMAAFSVTASGTPQLFYQWQFNGTNIANATNAMLTLANVQLTNSGNYMVTVTNLYGGTNSAVTALTVYGLPPSIVIQPTNQTVLVGRTAAVSVTATGTLPLFYQWQFNGTNIANATNATLTLVNVQLTNAGNYAVVITNLYGATNSAAAVLAVIPPPSCDPDPAGIISWWRGEGNGFDSVSGNNASVPSNITYPAGEVGQGFNFDGTANLVVANTPALNPTNALTIECWVYPRTRLSQVTWSEDFFTKDGECSGRQYILQVGDHQTVSGAGDFRAALWLSSGPVVIDSA
ncbi:MAG TPA: LamG-like jellyroll fold domain-containing protein, partial [Verrucomicrobiae bacterium]|nr:LamG-like jellyroll fold domain-containing protein [Verrucomicrobiae bacterium]